MGWHLAPPCCRLRACYFTVQRVTGHVLPLGCWYDNLNLPRAMVEDTSVPHFGHAWVNVRLTWPSFTRNCLPQCPDTCTSPVSKLVWTVTWQNGHSYACRLAVFFGNFSMLCPSSRTASRFDVGPLALRARFGCGSTFAGVSLGVRRLRTCAAILHRSSLLRIWRLYFRGLLQLSVVCELDTLLGCNFSMLVTVCG